jgi:hypothetical protein
VGATDLIAILPSNQSATLGRLASFLRAAEGEVVERVLRCSGLFGLI